MRKSVQIDVCYNEYLVKKRKIDRIWMKKWLKIKFFKYVTNYKWSKNRGGQNVLV